MTHRPGGDVDLTIFLSRRCKGQRGSEGGVEMARRDKFTREMGELFNVVVDIMERSISGKYIYKKKRRVHILARWLCAKITRLIADHLAQSRSNISFIVYARDYFSLPSGVCTTKKFVFSNKRGENKQIKEWVSVLAIRNSRKFVQPKEQRQRRNN